MKTILRIIIFLLLLPLLAGHDLSAAQAASGETTYYVQPDHPQAADKAKHGTKDKPWQTLGYAFHQLKPGDTLLVREGTYVNSEIKLTASHSGREDAPITVKAYPDEKVILENGGDLKFLGASWWIIEGFIFQEFELGNIIRIGSEEAISRHITIRNCLFRDTRAEAISLLFGEDILIENNYFARINTYVAGEGAHGIDILRWAKRVIIRNNRFVDIGADGIHLGATVIEPVIEEVTIEENEFWMTSDNSDWGENGIDVKTVNGPLLIRKNYFHGFRPTYLDGTGHKGNSMGAGLVLHRGAQNVHIEGNVFEDNTVNLTIADQEEESRPTKNITVVNNIIKDARYYKGTDLRPPGAGIGLNLNGVRYDIKIVHNTFINNDVYLNTSSKEVIATFQNNVIWKGRSTVSNQADLTVSHNAWSETEETVSLLSSASDLELQDLKMDSEFRPLADSPLLDSGRDVGVAADFDGQPRADGKPDLGAFEYRPEAEPAGTYLTIEPLQTEAYPGDAVAVQLSVAGADDLYGLQVTCTVDPTILALQEAVFDDFFTAPLIGTKTIDTTAGRWVGAVSQRNPAPALSGGGSFATLTLEALAPGQAAIRCEPLASDRDGFTLEMSTSDDSLDVLDVSASESGVISGLVTYQGRTDHSDITVTAFGMINRTSHSDDQGRFLIDKLEDNEYIIKADAALYLSSCTTTMVANGETIALAAAKLAGGDTDDDDEIRINDATLIGGNFGLSGSSSPGMNPKADINADGQVNVKDLTIIGSNFGKQGCQSWTADAGT